MTTFAILKADIEAWTARDDLSAVVASFIRIGEATISRRVRVLEQEEDDTLILDSADDYAVALPTGFLGFKHIFDSDASNPEALYIPPQAFHELNHSPRDAFHALASGHLMYTIEGNKLKGYAPPGSTDPITLDVTYLKRFTALSDSNTTNWLLENHYDIYLFAGLREAWDYIDETEQVAKYTARLDKSIKELDEQEIKKRQPAGPLVRRPPNVVV